uniref:Uncharacterized protein n=1 Tax=Glossina morsitans morsitans TaxID=37546 RepID=A0A1B0GCC8_GLOMM
MMKEVNNIDAPERARGDNNNKTIVDIIFEDFEATLFNSPIASPERKLTNLERAPLVILLENPKRYCSRKFEEKKKTKSEEKFKAAIDDNNGNMKILTSKRKINDTCEIPPNIVPVIEEILALKSKNIEYLEEELDICDGDFLGFPKRLQCKNYKHLLNICNQFDNTLIDEHIVNLNFKKSYDSISETLVSSNQCKTGISKDYHWDEDDNDFFASISIQEILDLNVKDFKKLADLGEVKNAVGVNEIFIENELEGVKNKMHQDEVGEW